MFSYLYTYETLAAQNDLNYDGPIIAYCPDWRRKKDSNGNEVLGYMAYFINNFSKAFEKKCGARFYYMRFDEKFSDIKDKVDGCFISGGRDIDPELYGEANTGSNIQDKEFSKARWDWCQDLFDSAPKDMPIFGICYGFEILNCIFGGKLVQDIENPHAHYEMREMKVKPGSHLWKAIGEKTKMEGQCYHHQGIKEVPDELSVTAVDDHDGIPHALEWKGDDRIIFTVLWHPESTKHYRGDLDEDNKKIISYFVERCRDYKKSRLAALK